MVSPTDIVKVSAKSLLTCGDDFRSMKQSVDSLYELFKSITGIDFTKWNDKDIYLPSGKAISAEGAAHCLLEFRRTAVFLRGIKQAIDFKFSNGKDLVRILYAGCGPYATLVVPLLSYFPIEKLKITLLDVNSVSLSSAQKLIETLELDGYIERYVLADAVTYKIDNPFDIIISETMQSGLKNEPQVAIVQNLVPQCGSDTILIPEKITIDAYLLKRGVWKSDLLLEEGGETKHLCELFAVSKDSLDEKNYRRIISIPADLDKPYDLLLYTTIKVFDNEVLGLNNCSLNLPLKYFELREGYPKSIEFWYSQSDKPRIESKVLDYIT